MYCCHKNLNGYKFKPNYTLKPLTAKFYARHDNDEVAGDYIEQYKYFSNEIEKRINYDNRNRYRAPITENQTYGWLERSAEKYTGLDKEILMHKFPLDEMMRVMKQVSFDIHRLKTIKRK